MFGMFNFFKPGKQCFCGRWHIAQGFRSVCIYLKAECAPKVESGAETLQLKSAF